MNNWTNRHRDFLAAGFLAIGSILLQFVFLNPPVLSDQLNYFFLAKNFPDMPVPSDHQSMRLGLILPLAGLIRILGYTEAAYYFLPLAVSAAFSISIYLLGRRFFNRFVSLTAAILPLLMPYMLRYAGFVIPDVLAAVLFNFSVLLVIPGKKSKNQSGMRRNISLAAAGFLFGWAYLSREYLLALAPVILFVFIVYRRPIREIILLGLGFAIPFSFEMLFNARLYGDPLARLNTASPRLTGGNFSTDPLRIASYFGVMLANFGGGGYLLLILTLAVGAFFNMKRKKYPHILFVFWSLNVYSFLTAVGLLPVFFSWSDRVLLRINKFRYWIPILPALTLGGIAGMAEMFERLKLNKITAAALIAVIFFFVAASGIAGIYEFEDFIHSGGTHFLELREFIRKEGQQWDSVWITRDSFRALERVVPMYLVGPFGKPVWKGEIRYLNPENGFVEAEKINGMVVVHTIFMNPNYYSVPDYLVNPPSGWKLVFESRNGILRGYDTGR